MKAFFEYFDVWGTNIKMHVNRKKNYTSWQAGIISFFFFFIALTYTLVQFYYFFNLFYTRKFGQTNYVEFPQLNVKDLNQFMFAFCHGTANNSTERDPIAQEAVYSTLEWHYFIRNPWLFEDKVYINLTECTKDDFPDFVKNTYTMRLFQRCQCASYNQLKDFNFSYFFTDSYNSYFAYKLMFKDEVVNNSTLYQYYSDYYRNNSQRVFTYFVDSQGNVDNLNDPFANYINYDYSYLSPDFSVVTDLFFSSLNVILDDNILFSSPKVYSGITLDNVLYRTSPYLNRFNKPGKTMLQVRFRSSTKSYMLSRSVLKLYEFLAHVISIVFIFFLIFASFNNYINNFELKKKLVFGLFKNFDVNARMMSQFKNIQEKFNEVEYKNNPDFMDQEENRQTIGSERKPTEKGLVSNFRGILSLILGKKLRGKSASIKDIDAKLKKIEMKKKEENERFNNDPIIFDELSKDIDKDQYFKEFNENIKKCAFVYSLSDILCRFFKVSCSRNSEEYKKRQKYFEDATSILDYYTDSITYFKKMLEIEIIKYYLFTKEERKLISIISNPDFIDLDRDHIYKKIDLEYQEDRFYTSNMDEIFTKVLKDGRNNSSSNKLLQLVQAGNNKLFYSEQI